MKGLCLCGAVSIVVQDRRDIEVCHCGMCRRWGGGPLFAVHCGSELQIAGSGKVKTYASSAWAERAFCGECGSHLYYRLQPTGEYIVPAGLFGDLPEAVFTTQIFIDKKPGYYRFANNTAELTEADVFAKYAARE